MTQSRNSTEILGTFRELKSCIQKAIADGYVVADDTVKLHLLRKAEETKVPGLLQKLWKMRHGCELPNDQELLQTREVKELFSPPEKTPQQRRNSTF